MRKHPKQRIKEICREKNGGLKITLVVVSPFIPYWMILSELLDSSSLIMMWSIILTLFTWAVVYWIMEGMFYRQIEA